MLKFIVGFLIGCMVGCSSARAEDCGPCKIVGTIAKPDKTVVEQFKYPFTFETRALCDGERDKEFFKDAMKDLQAKADNLGQLGDEFKNLSATADCYPLDSKPVHP
jgi:hypothetical protein